MARSDALRPLRVLIVEDYAPDAELLLLELERGGYAPTAERVETPEAMRAALDRQAWDLVLADYALPRFNVMAAIAMIRERGLDVPIIAVSGTADERTGIEVMKAGAHDFFLKDNLRLFVSAVRRELEDAGQRRRRERAEHALRESERRYRELFEESKDAIFISAPDGRLIDVNPAAVEMLGYPSRRELLETHADRLYVDPADRQRLVRELEAEGFVKDFEQRLKSTRGEVLTVLETSSAVRDERGTITGYRGILRDITTQRQLEHQFRQSQKLEAVGQLAGGIAHDFNNLLTLIAGNAEIALTPLLPDDPLRRNLEDVLSAAERAAGLTRQLLAFSRRQVLQPKVLDLNAVIAGIEKLLRRTIGEDVELAMALDPELGRVRADPGQIEQVLMNLAVNARDAMPGGGRLSFETANVELDDELARSHVAVTPGFYVMLAITDTGCGMDRETQNRVFEPFFTTKDPGKGTGLGLSTVYGIVKQSGGFIWVDSEPGHGTTFKTYLPRVEDQAAWTPVDRASDRPTGGCETILLVEDEEGVRKLAALILERQGYRVHSAGDPAEAVRRCEQHRQVPDLLVTDMVMPTMSGLKLAKRILALLPETKVLYISGYVDKAVLGAADLVTDKPFLAKPFTAAALLRSVREVLDGTWRRS